MTTADWAGGSPETGSATWRVRHGIVWGRRRVRPDGTVRFAHRLWRPRADVQTMPVPGEWLLFTDHGYAAEPLAYEWTAPADPDGYIRRMYWEVVP